MSIITKMGLPAKRVCPENQLIQSSMKKFKASQYKNPPKFFLKPAFMIKNIWIEILDYLETKSCLLVISKVDKFFNSLVKNYENFRASLDFKLIIEYSGSDDINDYRIVNSKCIDCILKSKLLSRLKLKFASCGMNMNNIFRSDLNFSQILLPMPTLKTLKILKINVFENFEEEVLKFINLFENLEELKIKFNNYSPEAISLISEKYIKNDEINYYQNRHLRKLSLNISYDDIFNDLDHNIGLEKFSLKQFRESRIFLLPKFLKNNYNLRCIKLPNTFFFTTHSAIDLCQYIKSTTILEELNISESIFCELKLFINAIQHNQSLKILTLNHFIEREIGSKDSCELICKLSLTSIEDFSMTTFISKTTNINYNSIEEFWSTTAFKNQKTIFYKSLNYLLSKSKKLRKIALYIPDVSYKYAGKLAKLIIKHVKIGNIRYFAGYDLKMLIKNKIDIMTIKKKGNKKFQNSCILANIFWKFLGYDNRIVRFIKQSQSKKEIDVEKMIKNINEDKRLIINPEKTNEITRKFSPLHLFSLLTISTRIVDLKELDIRNYKFNCYIDSLPKFLKSFKSLEKLKFFTINCYNNTLINIFKAIFALKKILLINWDLISNNELDLIDIFDGLNKHQTLRKFKLENSGFKLSDCFFGNEFEDFISHSKLISLNLYKIELTYCHMIQLANGLKNNNTITYLRLEKLPKEQLMPQVNSIYLIEVFLMILASLESKNHYERISIFFSYKERDMSQMSDTIAEQYLSRISQILLNNRKLKEFNVFLIPPYKYFLNYSEILLNAYENSEVLKTINFIDLKLNLSNLEKTSAIVKDWYKSGHPFICGSSKLISNYCFFKLMGIFIIEFIKKHQPLIVGELIEYIIRATNAETMKKLNFNMEYDNNWSDVYKLNLLEYFSSLEELTMSISMNSFAKLEIIEKNIQKLDCLHTIKFQDKEYGDDNLNAFLSAKNLTYLKIFNSNILKTCLEGLSEKIKLSRLEKLTLKHIKYLNIRDDREISFLELIKAITCSSLKVLKVYIDYTPILLEILISRLKYFASLEFIGVSILSNYGNFNIPIKSIISIMQDEGTSLYKIKVNNYIWNIRDIKDKEKLEIIECNLNPADLIVLCELCERKIMKNLKCVDLSCNQGIIDENFEENMTRIIRALGSCEIIMENSGCSQKNIKTIKNLLGYERGSLLSFKI